MDWKLLNKANFKIPMLAEKLNIKRKMSAINQIQCQDKIDIVQETNIRKNDTLGRGIRTVSGMRKEKTEIGLTEDT